MSPHPIPSLSGFNPIMSRRVLFGGATAVAAAGVLSACGSSSSKTEHRAGETPLYEINEQDPSKLKQGGTLNLSTYSLGPDFNRFSQNGSSTSVSETMGVIASAGIWRSTYKGEDEIDPNYCLGFEAKEVDGKITAEVRLNPKAVFNDGTPSTLRLSRQLGRFSVTPRVNIRLLQQVSTSSSKVLKLSTATATMHALSSRPHTTPSRVCSLSQSCTRQCST